MTIIRARSFLDVLTQLKVSSKPSVLVVVLLEVLPVIFDPSKTSTQKDIQRNRKNRHRWRALHPYNAG